MRKVFTAYNEHSLAKILRLDEDFLLRTARRGSKNYVYAPRVIKSKWRDIYEPNKSLQIILERIDEHILDHIDFPPSMIGALKGGSLIKNASIHMNANVILKVDIKDFFPSITKRRVIEVFIGLGIASRAARLLAELTTVNSPEHLPQGFTTSPKIALLTLLNFDKRIHRLSKQFKKYLCTHSFWIDDIIISANFEIGKLKRLVSNIIESERFKVNDGPEKLKVMSRLKKDRMIITGVVVNDHPNVPREYRERLSKELYEIDKQTPTNFLQKYGYTPSLENVERLLRKMTGKISHVDSINPMLGAKYWKMLRKIKWKN